MFLVQNYTAITPHSLCAPREPRECQKASLDPIEVYSVTARSMFSFNLPSSWISPFPYIYDTISKQSERLLYIFNY